MPRTIYSWHKWKATEWRNWALYDMLPCLENVVPPHVHSFLAKLSEALYILNQSSILLEELQHCKLLLREFHVEFEQIFGRIHMTYNLHLLVFHLPDSVFEHGPGWALSADIFEAMNFDISRFVTSPKDIQLQIAVRFLIQNFVLNSLHDDLVNDKTKNFVRSLLQRSNNFYRMENFHALSTFDRGPLLPRGLEILRSAGFDDVEEIVVFTKVQIYGVEYRSYVRNNPFKFCNSNLCYDNDSFGRIKKIVAFISQNERRFGCMVQVFENTNRAFQTSHMKDVRLTNEIIFVDCSRILAPAFIIETALGKRAVAVSNLWERD